MDRYRNGLRSAVRGLWSGVLDEFEGYDALKAVVENAFGRAWRQGAAECGIAPDEFTPEEEKSLTDATAEEFTYIDGLVDAAINGSRKNDGKLEPLYNRVELWVKRFLDIQNRAKAMACGDKKLKWVINPQKENCCSCRKLSGRVKRASFWVKAGVRPQHESLHCMESAGGPSVCGCSFEVTSDPLSKGRLPDWRC